MQVNSRENWLFVTKHSKATGHSDNLYRNEQAEQLHTATGTGRREHVDVFLCAPIKSLIFFLSFYVMSLNNLLVSNVKRKLHRRDSSESSSGSPVEKRLKELLSDTPGDAIDDEFEGDEVFQVLNMSETLAKKMEEISRILNKLEVIEEKMRKLDSIEQKMENFSSKLGEIRRTL